MKYYIIAGEASGDLHGSNLIKALKTTDKNPEFRAWGGDLMDEAGADIVKHYRDLAFMGFLEVVKNLSTIRANFRFCKKDILAFRPDLVILIDYPGFNLRMAKWIKKQGFTLFYYISPQVWAWNTGRVQLIKKWVDKMFVILPFEKEFYARYNFEVDYIGHPLLDVVNTSTPPRPPWITSIQKPIIALLPGSRKQEVKRMLTPMLEVVPDFPNYHFIIAAAPAIPPGFYTDILSEKGLRENKNVSILHNQTYAILQNARAALVTSGTATLETALFKVPQVVCYQGNSLSYQIAKHLVKVKYISLVNLILDQPLLTELIQNDFHKTNLQSALKEVLHGNKREKILKGYALLIEKLGTSGAALRTAKLITKYMTD